MSYGWLWLLKAFRVSLPFVTQLRSLNLVQGAATLYFLLRQLLYHVATSETSLSRTPLDGNVTRRALLAFEHAALNTCLFPPLFFFHALFYTDITSSALVLHAYLEFRIGQRFNQFLLSVVALCLRQTNIFWVAIYLGGLEVVQGLPRGWSGASSARGLTYVDIMDQSWRSACLYDPVASEALLEGVPSPHIVYHPSSITNFLQTTL